MILETAKHYVNAFHHRHGQVCYFMDNLHWYEDGAYREEHPLGVLAEPPNPTTDQGEFDLLQNKLRFHQAKLKKMVERFDSFRDPLVYSIPTNQDEALKKLEELRHAAEVCQEEVRQAQKALDNSQIGKQRKGAQQFLQEQRAQQAEWQSKLKKIKL